LRAKRFKGVITNNVSQTRLLLYITKSMYCKQ